MATKLKTPRQDRGKTLPDYLRSGLDVVFVGINPRRWSAERGHHYAGPGNHFWPLLYKAGFVDRPVTYEDDARMPEHGIGLTNVVDRTTRAASELTREELRAGAEALRRRLRRYRPRIVAFNGKLIYEAFAGHGCDFGVQPERAEGAVAFVMPSTSPRGATYQLADKLRFFRELKRIVDRERRDAARR
jgi:TDG/mug DNA glycosylase family protein